MSLEEDSEAMAFCSLCFSSHNTQHGTFNTAMGSLTNSADAYFYSGYHY